MKLLLALTIVAGLSAVGCSSTARVSYSASEPQRTPCEAAAVAVLLDAEPDRPFRVVGELSATAIDSPWSIELMRGEAARAGLDGIYWIECSSPSSGRCKAKGFVYTTVGSTSGLDGERVGAR